LNPVALAWHVRGRGAGADRIGEEEIPEAIAIQVRGVPTRIHGITSAC